MRRRTSHPPVAAEVLEQRILLSAIAGQTLAVRGTNAANDVLLGGRGDDVLKGGGDNDVVLGGRGNDFLTGDAGDVIIGQGTLLSDDEDPFGDPGFWL